MSRPKLHLDEDASFAALQAALLTRGHDVTRTPNEWIARGATDELQLRQAAAQGRIVLTFNTKDFLKAAEHRPDHAGIVLAAQKKLTLRGLIAALDRMLSETTAEEWLGQVRWLSQWQTSPPE
jgi:hypothetical protein